ncbi:MAG: hypothetical protein QOG91_571 [Candidatus Parcubacteria bacterium]|jgi:hypothetical protein|nr:hypothetical protein [Candidatus Parcubacteria bacterium]
MIANGESVPQIEATGHDELRGFFIHVITNRLRQM